MNIKNEVIKDIQVKKFCAYGFLKNLKFFEPYLILYLMSKGIDLFEVGILIAIREITVNLLEIPSGFIADYFGRKKELYLCFGFYILSFVVFFYTEYFLQAIMGMIFFGLGEAFRSGTHKAMIYSYIDFKGWQSEKTYIYGRTRSFSLLGSALSSLMAIVLILVAPSDRYIFLFSIVPYLLDLALIISYPKFLDVADKNHDISIKEMIRELVNCFRVNQKLRYILIEEGMEEATFSYIKDMIQPILEVIILGSGIVFIGNLSTDETLKIILGLVYAILNLIGSYFSKKAYLIKGSKTSLECLSMIHIGYALFCGILAFLSMQYIAVFMVYICIYIVHSIRKPLFVDEIDNHMEKSNRATMISASAQLKSIFLMIFAPLLGYVAENLGISVVMFILSSAFLCTIFLLKPISKAK